MKTLVLTASDVRRVVEIVGLDALTDLLIERTSEVFRTFDPTVLDAPPRGGFSYTHPAEGLVEFMPMHAVSGTVTQKAVGYHPRNPRRGLPTILSTVSVYDCETGHLEALLDGVILTALRTGAASAIACRALAHPESAVLGLIGCGAQAVAQLHAISRVLPIRTVLFHDVEPAVAQSLEARCRTFGLQVVFEAATPASIVERADVITTATSVDIGAGPVFPDGAHKPHLHVNAVGSDFPGKVECPVSLLRRATVVPDFAAQARVEGECQQLGSDQVGPMLYEVLNESTAGLQRALTVFDSTGWSVEDHVAAELLVEQARGHGIGWEVELESVPADPHDPYGACLADVREAAK